MTGLAARRGSEDLSWGRGKAEAEAGEAVWGEMGVCAASLCQAML